RHYAVEAAASHNYIAFYEREITYRHKLRQPPFNCLARLVYAHTSDALCRREAERMRQQLEHEISSRGLGGIEVLGAAPAFPHRLRGRFRWQ
ncbi:MAG: primosomal protein N', partial [Dehalococcoidales bacterium]|nr:primosomal protein N' [Dehalococcoidales bacterium]